MKLIKYTLLNLFLLFYTVSSAQTVDIKQTIRGVVLDAETRTPLIGASIIIPGSDPFLGATTDLDGRFTIGNVPIGRANLQVTYIGYEPYTLDEILITSAKELVLEIGMYPSFIEMQEVVVQGQTQIDGAENELSMTSARAFSVEETKRYAGSLQDPARMALSYAGVAQNPSGYNDIIIRGNSPRGLQYRMEGIEIPNPNHFSETGSSGGVTSALNVNLLKNSDFLTGAFTAEYGNAFSGVFDLNLRNGNSQNREYSFQVGALGTDITLEGPLKKDGQASYLVNYRYSTLGLLVNTIIPDFGGVPTYQDASFKLHLPTKNAGVFSLWGIAGLSDSEDSWTDTTGNIGGQGKNGSNLGVLGLSHHLSLGDNIYLKSVISLQGTKSYYTQRSRVDSLDQLVNNSNESFDNTTIRTQTTLNYRPNKKMFIRAGAAYNYLEYNMFSEWRNLAGNLVSDLNDNGSSGYYQLFGTFRYRLTERLAINGGLHYIELTERGQNSLEPRVNGQYKLSDRSTLTAGFGVHSRHEPIATYKAEVYNENDELGQWNNNLELAKSKHYVLGYSRRINDVLFAKVEVYYQDLYDIPVEASDTSYRSTINQESYYASTLLNNEGTGSNKGIELTIEHRFKNNIYYMFTGSLYDSRYVAMDGIERQTAFNGKYAFNVAAGKEIPLESKRENQSKTLLTNMRFAWAGGYPYTPLDEEASKKTESSVRDYSRYLGEKAVDFYRLDVSVGYRIDRAKTSQTFLIDIQNVTNMQAKVYPQYNSYSGEIEWGTQLGIIPNISWKIDF